MSKDYYWTLRSNRQRLIKNNLRPLDWKVKLRKTNGSLRIRSKDHDWVKSRIEIKAYSYTRASWQKTLAFDRHGLKI